MKFILRILNNNEICLFDVEGLFVCEAPDLYSFKISIYYLNFVIKIFALKKRFGSSANKMVLKNCALLIRSFIYSRNNVGPKIEPCGTPQLIFSGAEVTLFRKTH